MGDVHSPTAANSDPPAKFRPVISGTASDAMPFAVACAPSTSAAGTRPISTGADARKPRANSPDALFMSDANVAMMKRITPIKGRVYAKCYT